MRLVGHWHHWPLSLPLVAVVGGWPVLSPPPTWSQWTFSSPVTSSLSAWTDIHYTANFIQHFTTFTIFSLHKLLETGRYHIMTVLIITEMKCHLYIKKWSNINYNASFIIQRKVCFNTILVTIKNIEILLCLKFCLFNIQGCFPLFALHLFLNYSFNNIKKIVLCKPCIIGSSTLSTIFKV